MKHCSILLLVLISLVTQQAKSQATRDTLISIYFSTNAYELDSMQSEQLAALAASIASVKQVTGYADSRGSKPFNLQLSQRRAAAVANALASLQPELKVEPLYKGESDTQHAVLWKNRRVDIVATLPIANATTKAAARVLDLDNIYFVPDSAVIAPQSLPLIRELANTLQNYQGEHFEIIGHANCQQTLDPSKIKNFYRLSEQRAKLIYLLLIEHGIPADKMSYKGIGNTLPAIEDPKSVEEKKMNMRVQILITQRS